MVVFSYSLVVADYSCPTLSWHHSVMYQRGGVFVITTRILIVDLLTNVASAKDIDGILVAHAENVTEQSTEAFILRIYRTQTQFAGRNGFVKAFSDAADVLMSGFAKVDKILKALHVRRLYLYPRFHATVADELERRPPNVDELHQVCLFDSTIACASTLFSLTNSYYIPATGTFTKNEGDTVGHCGCSTGLYS